MNGGKEECGGERGEDWTTVEGGKEECGGERGEDWTKVEGGKEVVERIMIQTDTAGGRLEAISNMDRLAVLLVSFLACVSTSSNFTTYDGHKVYKIFPTESQAGLLKIFHDLEGYDFWGSYHNVSTGIQELDLMVTPEQQEYFVKFLKDKNIEYSTLVEDLETVFKAERVQQNSKRASSRISFDSYLRYDQIRAYLLQLATNYPTLVTVENIGFTYEGRPIVIAKISSGGQGSRPVIAIEAGIHAREWIAPATAVYIINQLVENSENSDLISNVDWHIVPVTNPDGYEFSHTTTRLWRKTLTGASSNPCSETYGGTHAFSESETVAYHNYILGNKDRIKLYLATHSYGNVNAAAGGSDDWVKAVGGVDYAYTLELPGGGNSGFDLPASQIARTVSTFFPAIRIRAYLLQLATNYPTLVTVENIGFTYEGRPIVIAKISSGGQGSRPVIAIEAGIHAREWIAPATAVYIINQLVENSENSDLISNVDWHIVPVTNPDGYEFSHTTLLERAPIHALRRTGGPTLSRNRKQLLIIITSWVTRTASSCTSLHTAMGTIRQSGNGPIHFSLELKLLKIFTRDDNLAKSANKAQVSAGAPSYSIDATGGASVDWVKAVAGVGYGYTIELPGGGSFGFDLPASRILSTVSAYFNAVRVFGDHKVYKVFPTESQAGLLKTFRDLEGYDFWGSYHNVSTGIQELDLMVTPEQQEYFVKFLKDKNIEYSPLVEDLETVFKAERVQQNSKRASSRISFDSYLRYDQIRAYLLQLATNYPTLVTVENIGFTYEGRPIVIAKISSGGQGSRPVIAIEAGIHAREWIAPATAVYIINQLVENSENSDLISNVDWHIVPVTNPDGYEFSHTTTRLWRKTRSRLSSSICIGTDPNRNFDFYWMDIAAGGSDDWVKGVGGVKYSYTVELPGGGIWGFDLPASRILSTVTSYFPAIRIQSYLRKLEKKYHKLVRVESIGKTYEGREILVIQISTDRSARRPIVLIDAGIHAREWIAPSMALYIINRLVENQIDTEELAAKVDWHIVPVINPDGYEYTHTKVGASSDPCDDTFSGTKGFSEVESQALQKYALKFKKRIKMYLTLHCYGNLILYPWGFTRKLPENWKDLHDLAVKASEAHVKAGGEKYTIGSSTNVLYPAAGGSDDWMKGVIGVEYSYTIEMTQKHGGFIMNPALINETVVRFFEAIRVFGKFVADMEPN
uniref:Peptidase M14 domain-containing protein n=1 Tax=Timema douglasi TaxID=61478 RepID=A0A7R8Z7S0_TIMDO|nr:unnamed protein product [Timema douglasi]